MSKLIINHKLCLFIFVLSTNCIASGRGSKTTWEEAQLLNTYIKQSKENKDSLRWKNVNNFTRPEIKFTYLKLYFSVKVNGKTFLMKSSDIGPLIVLDLELNNENIKSINDFAFFKPIFNNSTARDYWDYKEACESIGEKVIKEIGWYDRCLVFLKDAPKNGYYMSLVQEKESVVAASECKFLSNEEKELVIKNYGEN